MNTRTKTALSILKERYNRDFFLLGEGSSSVVFHDKKKVFKVFILDDFEALKHKTHLINNLKSFIEKFKTSQHFYPIEDIIEISSDRYIVTYKYEEGEQCESFEIIEIQDFLVECWQKRIVFQDVKPDNFIRVNQYLKWIDYEPDKFSDNLYLNMAVRAFIYAKYSNESQSFLYKLRRSAINQFSLPELNGLQEFLNQLYAKIIFCESKNSFPNKNLEESQSVNEISEIKTAGIFHFPYTDEFNPENAFWSLLKRGVYVQHFKINRPTLNSKNYFEPENIIIQTIKLNPPPKPISLVIKACVQDAEVLQESVKHILKQLASPNLFDEKILALDIRKNNFLREYKANNTWENLLSESNQLIESGIIDKVFFPNQSEIKQVNKKWFGTSTTQTHTIKKVPVSAQLHGFEQAKNDYVLQMDCDVMIGRIDASHSFLNDMISEIESNQKVLSVGFNIYKGKETSFTKYFGFENGGYVPEVRFCLLKKSRIEEILPLSNQILEDGFKLSWYRALEQRQKETDYVSIRGGDSRSFFIHPQNFKKKNKDVWFTTVDRVEKLQIPVKQINNFDQTGSFYDWTLAKRNEEMVIVSCFRNIPISRFLRYWYSLISQTKSNWGLVLIDDASENGISHFIEELIKPFSERVTFIRNRYRMGVAHNTYKAIHYFMENPESVVSIIDADDALLGKNALKNLFEKYSNWEADTVIGKMYRTDKLAAHYPYKPNFINPRAYGGNVWQHLRSFKKYLFDSLDFRDLKIKNLTQEKEDILLSRRFSKKNVFPEHCWDFAYMVPIVEMSSNPIWINHFNIYHDRTTLNTPEIKQLKENIIAEILSKPAKTPDDIVQGRRTFLPNLSKIEIDITYECNLKCINCNRSSTQAPIKEGMTIEQIKRFVNESIELDKKWELINLLGGEPTIHKDFQEIVNIILNDFIIPYSPKTILQITSNGFGELVNKRLANLPKHPNVIIDYASFKDDRVVSYFSPFNDAPIDNPKAEHHEYHKGCWVTSYCGIGLNQLGYYPCGVAGGIDRVMQFDIGVKSLKQVDESIKNMLEKFCKFCGNFTDYQQNRGNFIPRHEKAALNKPIVSNTWKTAYKSYNLSEKKKPN